MLREDLLLRTKLAPPRPQRRALARPALVERLAAAVDYRLTVVQAAAGYGKTTSLAALDDAGAAPNQAAHSGITLFWYTAGPEDADPQQFLSYLIGAFRSRLPGLSETPWVVLGEISAASGVSAPYAAGQWLPAVDALVNALAAALPTALQGPGPALLVLDDYHLAASPEVDALTLRFLTYLPPELHVIIATRRAPFPERAAFAAWRARGEVLEIDRTDLAFRTEEIEALFRTSYGMLLELPEVAVLAEVTEGWPIALQMVWQGLRRNRAGRGPETGARVASEGDGRDGRAHAIAEGSRGSPVLADLLPGSPGPLAALFDYLARDVLAGQPPDVAAFLTQTSVLRELTPAACASVTGDGHAAGEAGVAAASAMLDRLHEQDLFIVALGGRHYRYHHLFHDFLREMAGSDPAGGARRHRRAASFFREQGDAGEAIYHWLAAAAYPEAAAAVEAEGDAALRAGRLETVAGWIDALPAAILAESPRLQAYLGDVYRLRSRFDEALAWYGTAERTCRARGDRAGLSRALRGQALVYLDTVRPAEAESLLAEALRVADGLADRAAQARLLELLAENKLNMGKPDEAETLRLAARRQREEGPGEDVLSVRVRLRTGRLDEAQRILEAWAQLERRAAERGQAHAPRAHRETVLILSLILTLRGQGEQARTLAEEGIALGERLSSPFITAVGHVRLGHALQLSSSSTGSRRDAAIRSYQAGITLGDQLAVRRIRAEAMWGLTRAYGFFPTVPGASGGDLESARRAAAEGIEIGRWAGDPWIVALTELALGGGHVLAGQAGEALETLQAALAGFRDCGDTFGRAAARLWLGLACLDLRQGERAAAHAEELLALCETHDYDFLLTTASLLGPPDPRRLAPLLLHARSRGLRPAYVARLLAAMGLPEIQVHPGYRLSVQTLGAFRVWRGDVEVSPREWQRDKARQLFQLLLGQGGRWLQREEIVDRLWPELSPEAAARDFKVALNALNRAVEPNHAADAAFAFVVRDGTAYALRPEADLWVDARAFVAACEAGLAAEGKVIPAAAIVSLEEAMRLYAGDYLPDALYEDWAIEERERLLTLYLRAADRLGGAMLAQGRYDAALDACAAILAHDPCWERAYRIMMAAYARQGNRPQALRAYQRCVQALHEELAVEPSVQTIEMYRQLANM